MFAAAQQLSQNVSPGELYSLTFVDKMVFCCLYLQVACFISLHPSPSFNVDALQGKQEPGEVLTILEFFTPLFRNFY